MLEETLSGDLFSLMKIDFQLTELEVVTMLKICDAKGI